MDSKTHTTPYLPHCWNNDMEMQGYLTMIKAREVNPVDYDRKVRFWSDAIGGLCEGERNALFGLDYLKRKFRRESVIPSSLHVVLEHMKTKGQIISVDDWREQHSDSWVGWSVSRLAKTSSWFFGAAKDSVENSRFIHLSTINNQADDVLSVQHEELSDDTDGGGSVIAYNFLYDKVNHIVKTKENFDIVLELLCDRGDATVGVSRSGDKVIKFKDSGDDDGPVKFTEADASVHDIRRAMTKIEREISSLEKKRDKLDADCRTCIRNGDKSRAASFLRNKKKIEKDISDKDGQFQGLLTMLHQLGSTKFNKEVLDAYKVGASAFKDNLSRHGLSPEKVDETMDSIATSIDDYKEVEEAMSRGFGLRRPEMDRAELEKELDELMGEETNMEAESAVAGLPAVPSNNLGGMGSPQKKLQGIDQDSLEKRLARLREMSA